MNKTLSCILLALLFVAAAPLAAQTKVKVKRYPLETCIVSGDKLGAMGKPVRFATQGREIILCCQDCRKDFDKEPARYLKLLEK